MIKRYALDGERKDLRDPDSITTLMAQDMNDLRREQSSVTQPDLVALGWDVRQVKAYYLRALEVAFRSYCETSPTDTVSLQAAPFLAFDDKMKTAMERTPSEPEPHFFEIVERPGLLGGAERARKTFTSYLRKIGFIKTNHMATTSDEVA